jgi:hypothetical protein
MAGSPRAGLQPTFLCASAGFQRSRPSAPPPRPPVSATSLYTRIGDPGNITAQLQPAQHAHGVRAKHLASHLAVPQMLNRQMLRPYPGASAETTGLGYKPLYQDRRSRLYRRPVATRTTHSCSKGEASGEPPCCSTHAQPPDASPIPWHPRRDHRSRLQAFIPG